MDDKPSVLHLMRETVIHADANINTLIESVEELKKNQVVMQDQLLMLFKQQNPEPVKSKKITIPKSKPIAI